MNEFTAIPFKDITNFGQRTMLDRPLFNVSWILGRFCNYNCSYCWPYARTDIPDHFSLEVYKKTVDEIKRQARQNGFTEFHWSFSGGEPTAYKHLLDLVKHLDDGPTTPYQSVHMTTNLSPGSKWWNTWCSNTEMLQRRSITASFHDEFAKEQEFGDKCLQLMYERVFVTVNQVMVPEKFFDLYERMSRLHERGINVTLKPQSDPTASRVVDGYTPEMLKRLHNGMPQRAFTEDKSKQAKLVKRPEPRFYKTPDPIYQDAQSKIPQHFQVEFRDKEHKIWYMDQAERFNAFNFNKFKGWECSSGYRGIIIREPDGSIKRSYSCSDVPLGNIETGFQLFDGPKPCISDSCVSSADSKIPKRAPGTNLPLWPGDETYLKSLDSFS
jgi:hypothetical protein